MGGVIVAEDWLLRLGERGVGQRALAYTLLRMQILTSNRSGHLLILGSEYHRRAICTGAAWNRVPAVVVPCARCHCLARLSDWERASRLTPEMRRDAANRTAATRKPWMALFLRDCPGEQYAADILTLTSLPREYCDDANPLTVEEGYLP